MKKFIFALIIIGFFTYFPSLFGGFVWDDEDLVYQNRYVADFNIAKIFSESSGSGRGKLSTYYRPLQLLDNAIIHKFFGFSPFFYHLNSVAWHILAASLLFIFLKLLLDSKIAFLVSLFFLIHPVQTEAVTYISGLADPMFFSFMFLSLILFLKKEEKSYYWLISLLFFILSFFAKELGLLTLGIIFLLEIFFRKEKINQDIGVIFLFLIAAIFLFLLRLTVFNFVDMALAWSGTLYGQSLLVRLATFFQNFFLYFSLLLYPKELFMERSASIKIVNDIFSFWTAAFLVFNFLVLLGLWFFSQRKIVNGRVLSFFWLGFLLSLLPFSGIILINDIFYEHFLYLPQVFFWGFVFGFLERFWQRKVFWLMVLMVAVLFIGRSYFRQYEWIDSIRFYEQTLRQAPKSSRVINNLGMEWANRGEPKKAMAVYQRGIAVDPYVPNLYHNLANVYLGLKDYPLAETYYRQAIKVDPNFYFSYYSLVDLYLKQNKKDKAKEFLEKEALPKLPYNQKLKELYWYLTTQEK